MKNIPWYKDDEHAVWHFTDHFFGLLCILLKISWFILGLLGLYLGEVDNLWVWVALGFLAPGYNSVRLARRRNKTL